MLWIISVGSKLVYSPTYIHEWSYEASVSRSNQWYMDPCWNLPNFYVHFCATYSQKKRVCIYIYIHMGVSKNNGTPKSSILIGLSIINHPSWGYHYFWKHPYISIWSLTLFMFVKKTWPHESGWKNFPPKTLSICDAPNGMQLTRFFPNKQTNKQTKPSNLYNLFSSWVLCITHQQSTKD